MWVKLAAATTQPSAIQLPETASQRAQIGGGPAEDDAFRLWEWAKVISATAPTVPSTATLMRLLLIWGSVYSLKFEAELGLWLQRVSVTLNFSSHRMIIGDGSIQCRARTSRFITYVPIQVYLSEEKLGKNGFKYVSSFLVIVIEMVVKGQT